MRVEGSLKLATPIQLFDKSASSKDIFTFEKTFPVPSLSIGPLGVQAVILAGVSAGYSFGPGQLKNVAIEAAFNPLAEKIDPSLKFHCDLDIPANVNLTAKIGGGLRLEAGVGRVTGTITIAAKLGLDMSVGGPLDVTYSNDVFAINAKPGIDAALKLGLSLDAYGKAEIGISPISAYIDKTWNLGRREVVIEAAESAGCRPGGRGRSPRCRARRRAATAPRTPAPTTRSSGHHRSTCPSHGLSASSRSAASLRRGTVRTASRRRPVRRSP